MVTNDITELQKARMNSKKFALAIMKPPHSMWGKTMEFVLNVRQSLNENPDAMITIVCKDEEKCKKLIISTDVSIPLERIKFIKFPIVETQLRVAYDEWKKVN